MNLDYSKAKNMTVIPNTPRGQGRIYNLIQACESAGAAVVNLYLPSMDADDINFIHSFENAYLLSSTKIIEEAKQKSEQVAIILDEYENASPEVQNAVMRLFFDERFDESLVTEDNRMHVYLVK